MVKMLLELSDNEDKIVEVYKVVKGMNSKQDAIKEMIRYFEVEIKPKNVKEKDYYQV